MTSIVSDALAALPPQRWLVTGCAGFIGSHLVAELLRMNQTVVGLDNFATGHRHNLNEIRQEVGPAAWAGFQFIEGDIADAPTCEAACQGVDRVLHQAALGSVPRSIADPLTTHRANATGSLNMLVAAHKAGVKRVVYAASSSTYGDSPTLPKVEDRIGRPLSPYAVTKYVNELYADVFARSYGLQTIGLRYFNVFGPRQDPNGAYAAVIPRWVAAMLRSEVCTINGDGETSRDFCYVRNVVQANLLAALSVRDEAINQVYNIAVGQRTTLKQLHDALATEVAKLAAGVSIPAPQHVDFRAGDVRHSLADIGKAQSLLAYAPTHTVRQGITEAVPWYVASARALATSIAL